MRNEYLIIVFVLFAAVFNGMSQRISKSEVKAIVDEINAPNELLSQIARTPEITTNLYDRLLVMRDKKPSKYHKVMAKIFTAQYKSHMKCCTQSYELDQANKLVNLLLDIVDGRNRSPRRFVTSAIVLQWLNLDSAQTSRYLRKLNQNVERFRKKIYASRGIPY